MGKPGPRGHHEIVDLFDKCDFLFAIPRSHPVGYRNFNTQTQDEPLDWTNAFLRHAGKEGSKSLLSETVGKRGKVRGTATARGTGKLPPFFLRQMARVRGFAPSDAAALEDELSGRGAQQPEHYWPHHNDPVWMAFAGQLNPDGTRGAEAETFKEKWAAAFEANALHFRDAYGAPEHPPAAGSPAAIEAQAGLIAAIGGPSPEEDDSADELDRFLRTVDRVGNQLPPNLNREFLHQQFDVLRAEWDDLGEAEQDVLGAWAFSLIELDQSLDRETVSSEGAKALVAAVFEMIAALAPPDGVTAQARTMPSDGEWPPGVREAVREKADDLLETLEKLTQDELAGLVRKARTRTKLIRAETFRDRPNWTQIAGHTVSIEDHLEALQNDSLEELRQASGQLRTKIQTENNKRISALEPGQIFRDLPDLPEMVIIPACPDGFWMGSPEDEEGRGEDEELHRVSIPHNFAMAIHAMSFEFYDRYFVENGLAKPADAGWGRGNLPAIFVTFKNAEDWCQWAAKRVGKSIRLPSEAEWEYACRSDEAGKNQTPFCPSVAVSSGGTTISPFEANWVEHKPSSAGRPPECETCPVDSPTFTPSRFGLKQMHGNIWEWVQDDYEPNMSITPTNGTPHVSNSVDKRKVVRGGSWSADVLNNRSATRVRSELNYTSNNVGFRPVRDLL